MQLRRKYRLTFSTTYCIFNLNLTIIDRFSVSHSLDAPTDMGLNLMELCKAADLPVEGTCGGMALCASCQVYIESSHDILHRTDDEEAMLDQAFHVKKNSRLGCQIALADNLEGLVVRLAPE
jgi:ferredoxin